MAEENLTIEASEELVEKNAPAKRTRKTAVKAEAEVATTEVKEEAPKAKRAPAKKTASKKVSASKEQVFCATGKRKRSIARVRMTVGTGKITINGRDIEEYLPLATLRIVARQPLTLTGTENSVDVVANIVGGGFTGQAGALRHGITRALMLYNPTLRTELKKAGFVTRDARIKERKKYGLKKARKAPQFSKR